MGTLIKTWRLRDLTDKNHEKNTDFSLKNLKNLPLLKKYSRLEKKNGEKKAVYEICQCQSVHHISRVIKVQYNLIELKKDNRMINYFCFLHYKAVFIQFFSHFLIQI